MDLQLKGKTAFITGGSVGIGLAVAHALAAEGVDVAICAREEERVQREARAIASAHRVKTLGICADVSKREDVDAAVKRIEQEFDGLDILINNAGTGSDETILDGPRRALAVLLGPARDGGGAALARAWRRCMKRRGRRGDPQQRLDLRQPAPVATSRSTTPPRPPW